MLNSSKMLSHLLSQVHFKLWFLNITFKSYFLFLQLNMAKKKEAFLQDFIEGPLQFKPTYKFDLYSDVYDTR